MARCYMWPHRMASSSAATMAPVSFKPRLWLIQRRTVRNAGGAGDFRGCHRSLARLHRHQIRLFVMSSAGLAVGENEEGMAVSGNGIVDVTSVQVSAVDHNILYATTDNPNNFYTSTDAGATWQQLNPAYPGEPAPGQYSGNSITFTLTPGGSDLYVIDGNGMLFKSTDGGMTWQQLAGNLFTPKSITIDPNNPSNIYVVDSVGVQLSTNGGVSFTTISPPFPGGVYVQAFALDSSTGDLYFATYNQIEVSVDHGATWKMLPPRLNPHVLIGLGNQVFAGVDSPSVPFVVKWSPDGSKMLYSTFFGGSYSDQITAITVDPQGEAIIAGTTTSSDFPVTQTISEASPAPASSGFVAKLSADGSQSIYSSLLGASKGVSISGLAIDSSGAPYIVGYTQSPDFPTTANVPQPKLPTTMCQRNSTNPLMPIANLAIYWICKQVERGRQQSGLFELHHRFLRELRAGHCSGCDRRSRGRRHYDVT